MLAVNGALVITELPVAVLQRAFSGSAEEHKPQISLLDMLTACRDVSTYSAARKRNGKDPDCWFMPWIWRETALIFRSDVYRLSPEPGHERTVMGLPPTAPKTAT